MMDEILGGSKRGHGACIKKGAQHCFSGPCLLTWQFVARVGLHSSKLVAKLFHTKGMSWQTRSAVRVT